MSKYIHPLTVEAAIEVASNLRPDDRREIEEGWGLDPMEILIKSAQSGTGCGSRCLTARLPEWPELMMVLYG